MMAFALSESMSEEDELMIIIRSYVRPFDEKIDDNHHCLLLTLFFSVSVDVEFCGYTITHPSESKINFRIQTRGERWISNPCCITFFHCLHSLQINLHRHRGHLE